METARAWQEYFQNWPTEMDRRGVVVTSFDEQIPFDGFATSEHLLLLDRKIPDTLGARKVLLSYEQVMAVKITDVVKLKAFQSLGFSEPVAKKAGSA